MIRPILRYGERGLHGRAADVTTFDDALQRAIDDTIETMYAAPGIGLAAPQIGVPLRAVIFGVKQNPRYPDAELMVAGDGPWRRYYERIARRLGPSVRFLGRIEPVHEVPKSSRRIGLRPVRSCS